MGFFMEYENDLDLLRERRRERSEMRETQYEKEERGSSDHALRHIFLQAVVCAVIVGLVFGFSKFSADNFEQLRAGYQKIMSVDMSLSEVWSSMKSAAAFVFSFNERFPEPSPASANKNDVEDERDKEAQDEITTEPAAELDGTGGIDLEKATPDNVSFAPVYTTMKPVMPVKGGRVSSVFGYRINPITGIFGFHTGIDIAAPEGTPIHASFYGTVRAVGEEEKRSGKYIVIKHENGLETFYCHCSEIIANVGDVIRPGEIIALVGSTGASTGPHLHYEVRMNSIRLNPEHILFPGRLGEVKGLET